MDIINKIEDFNTALPILKAVRNQNKSKRNETLKREVDLYFLGLLHDIGCDVSLADIENADDAISITICAYKWINAAILSINDKEIIQSVNNRFSAKGLTSSHSAVEHALYGDPKWYLNLLNEFKVSDNYLALYHSEDIVYWRSGDIHAIEHNQIIYK